MTETSQHIVKISADISGLESSFKQIQNSVGNLKGKIHELVGEFLTFEAAKKLGELASEMEGLRERVGLVTKNQADFNKTMDALFGIAQRTGSSLESIIKNYADMAVSARQTGIAQSTLLVLTENINKAVQISGGSTQEAAAATTQFVKAMSLGAVGSRQFMGILNQSTFLTQELADAITGGSVPALQKMAQEGKLTTEELVKLADPAITSQINSSFEGIASGLDKALPRLENSLKNIFSKFDDGAEGTGKFASALEGLSQWLDENTEAIVAKLDTLAKAATVFVGIGTTLATSLSRVTKFLFSPLTQGRFATEELSGGLQGVTKESDKAGESTKKFGGALTNIVIPPLHNVSQEAQNFQKTLEKLKDALDLKVEEEHNKNLGLPFSEADKELKQFENTLKENKVAFGELGPAGVKAADAIRESFKKLKLEEQDAKNFKFMQMAEEEIAAHQKQVEEAAAAPFVHALENIQDAFASAFEDIFTNGVDSFGDLADKMKSVMIKAAAEIAAALVFKPVLASTVSSLLGSTAPDLARSIIKGLGVETSPGSNGLGVMNPLSSIGSSLLGSSGIFSGFNASVASALPSLFGTGAPMAGVIGPMEPGLLSGLGMTPATMGLSMVAAIAIPMIASLFGGGTPHPGASFGGTLADSTNAFQGYDLRSKHMDTTGVDQLAQTLDSIFKGLGTAGIDLNNPTIQGRIDSNGKAQFGTGSALNGGKINWNDLFDPSDATALDDAIKGLMKQLLSTADVTNKDVVEALKNMDWEGKKVSDILNDLQLASTFDNLRKQLDTSLNKDLVGIFDPALKEISDENDRYAAQLALAKQISGDVATVERLHQERLNQIQNQYAGAVDNTTTAIDALNSSLKDAQSNFKTFSDLVKTLGDFSTSLSLGSLSPLSAQDKYRIAQGAFNQTASLARLGNTQAMSDLPKVAQDFLTISREFNAGSGAYTEDFNNVQKAVDDAKAVALRQQNIAETQMTTLQAQLSEMQTQTDLLKQLVDGSTGGKYSYGGKYLQALSNPMASGLVNTKIGETTDALSQRNFGWGGASGLEVRALARAFGFTGDFGTGLMDKWLQSNQGPLLTAFDDALTAIGGTPRFKAGGGMVTPGFPYIVGESGRERFIPNVQGRIANANETASMLSVMRGDNGNGTVQAIYSLTSEIRNTNRRIETLQKQVNTNMLFRRGAA